MRPELRSGAERQLPGRGPPSRRSRPDVPADRQASRRLARRCEGSPPPGTQTAAERAGERVRVLVRRARHVRLSTQGLAARGSSLAEARIAAALYPLSLLGRLINETPKGEPDDVLQKRNSVCRCDAGRG